MSRAIMQQALTALRISAPLGHAMEDYEYRHRLIKDIEAELAKPEQEPQMIQIKDGQLSYIKKPWVGLTDDEVYEIANFCKDQPFNFYAKEIENKLKEKNA